MDRHLLCSNTSVARQLLVFIKRTCMLPINLTLRACIGYCYHECPMCGDDGTPYGVSLLDRTTVRGDVDHEEVSD